MNVKPGAFVMSQYQPVRRDFAFMVDSDVAAADLMTTVRKASDKSLLQDVQLFDVYEGDKLPEGKKSVALSITLQAEDRTLKDDDINAVADKVIALAAKNHGAEIRG
jgi:phenylalanyl-tRNA synthetase beta chain